MGFSGYFLIVSDFMKWAVAHDIPVGPGRGSGAGSLVAWSLLITGIDPIRFGLIFERFLNPERVSMPDFDIDFCQERREEVIGYVQHRYGDDRVAQIITFGSLQARAVLRDVGRVMQLPLGQVDRLAKMIPNNPAAPVTLAQAIQIEPRLQQAKRDDENVAQVLEIALQLEGLYRNASTHAAGVVIADRPLTELAPLYRDPRSSLPATQFNMKWVESAGLVKFDFLGLKTLTVIHRAMAHLKARGAGFDIALLPLDDKPTYELCSTGHTVGVFQLEGQGMRDTLRKLRPSSVEEITALISLYRPGPMDSIDEYVDCKMGRRPITILPGLEESLAETYGVIVYQEQVMKIAQILAGYSLGEADLLRRAMGKKKKEEMDQQRARFLGGAADKGLSEADALEMFEKMAKFAGYGFNKCHAAPYALISYQTAWLKANAPVEFFAASMSLDLSNTEKLAVFYQDAKRQKVPIASPDINRSGADFEVSEGRVLYALGAVRNVGRQAMDHVVEVRRAGGAFTDIVDFVERVDPRQVNKRALESLARAGAFDAIHRNRAQIVAAADSLMAYAQSVAADRASAQESLFGEQAEASRPRLPKVEPWNPVRELDEELAAVGFYLSGHPLGDMVDVLRRHRTTFYVDAVTQAIAGCRGLPHGRHGPAPAGAVQRHHLRRQVRLRHPVGPHRRVRGDVPAGDPAPLPRPAGAWGVDRPQGPGQGQRRRGALLRRRRRDAGPRHREGLRGPAHPPLAGGDRDRGAEGAAEAAGQWRGGQLRRRLPRAARSKSASPENTSSIPPPAALSRSPPASRCWRMSRGRGQGASRPVSTGPFTAAPSSVCSSGDLGYGSCRYCRKPSAQATPSASPRLRDRPAIASTGSLIPCWARSQVVWLSWAAIIRRLISMRWEMSTENSGVSRRPSRSRPPIGSMK